MHAFTGSPGIKLCHQQQMCRESIQLACVFLPRGSVLSRATKHAIPVNANYNTQTNEKKKDAAYGITNIITNAVCVCCFYLVNIFVIIVHHLNWTKYSIKCVHYRGNNVIFNGAMDKTDSSTTIAISISQTNLNFTQIWII